MDEMLNKVDSLKDEVAELEADKKKINLQILPWCDIRFVHHHLLLGTLIN